MRYQRLNEQGSRRLPVDRELTSPPFVDVNGNGCLSPLDALLVISALNAGNRTPFVLDEGAADVTERSVMIGLGQTEGLRVYTFGIQAEFDTTDQMTATEDRLEVYLVDPADASKTLLDGGVSGTPIFVFGRRGRQLSSGQGKFRWIPGAH